MLTIHKYAIPIRPEFTLNLPARARILTVQEQDARMVLWALLDTTEPHVDRFFAVLATGGRCDSIENTAAIYIGTVQQPRSDLVFHVFEIPKRWPR